jgi:hypothetical protein
MLVALGAGCVAPGSGPTGSPADAGSGDASVSQPGGSGPSSAAASGGDRRGDLVRGRRSLTGTVQRTSTCTMLEVGTRRWILTGRLADSLTASSRVQVVGTLVPVPAECANPATVGALAVARARVL